MHEDKPRNQLGRGLQDLMDEASEARTIPREPGDEGKKAEDAPPVARLNKFILPAAGLLLGLIAGFALGRAFPPASPNGKADWVMPIEPAGPEWTVESTDSAPAPPPPMPDWELRARPYFPFDKSSE